jgi:uncharacterized peroxidase-related enzyme
MPFFSSLAEEDKVPHAFAKFNTGIERPLIELHQNLMRNTDSPFTEAQRELLAAFVSGTNACKYCTGAHTATAIEFGVDEELITGLLNDIDTSDADDNLKPVFKYIRKLTLEPTKMIQADADAVFNAGWSERALYDAIVICCTWNFMNRFVEGLGLSVIPEHFSMEGKMLRAGYDKIFDNFDLK